MNSEELKRVAAENAKSLEFIYKDMGFLVRRLKKTNLEQDELKFQSNLVEAAFYMNAYALATKAFKQMLMDNKEEPESKGTIVDYFQEQVTIMRGLEKKVHDA